MSNADFFSISTEKLFFNIVKTIAPTAPIDAASVGVAIPSSIDPRTRTISIIGKRIIFKVFNVKGFFLLFIAGA